LIGCWGDDLVWATVLAGVRTCCTNVGCCGGVVYTGILKIGWGVGLWGGTWAFISIGITIWEWAGLILTLSKALLPWLKYTNSTPCAQSLEYLQRWLIRFRVLHLYDLFKLRVEEIWDISLKVIIGQGPSYMFSTLISHCRIFMVMILHRKSMIVDIGLCWISWTIGTMRAASLDIFPIFWF
jgi:hypothetical protein